MQRLLWYGIVVTAAIVAGCDGKAGTRPAPITLLAAASTADAVEEVAERFRREHQAEVRISTGPSNGLAQQVLNGAPSDVFLSASPEWADAVVQKGHTQEVRPLLANRLVLVAPAGNPAGVVGPQDLTEDRVRRIALAGREVPAGRYADAALANLGLLEQLQSAGKIARGHDVRVALAFVERGEAEAGIVYATDAAISPRVEVAHVFDTNLHPPVVYPVALLKDGPAGEGGRKFFEYLGSPGADEIFRKHGFRTIEEAHP